MNNLEEKTISSQKVFSGNLLNVYKDEILLPNNNKSYREYIKHSGASAIIAIDNDFNVIMEEQFRYPFHKVMLEIPAGKIDTIDSTPLDTAKRELKEETGYIADKWDYLGEYIPTCAYSDEIIYLYLARDISKKTNNLDDDEFLNIKKINLNKLVDMVYNGEILDGKTQVIILQAFNYLKNNNSKMLDK